MAASLLSASAGSASPPGTFLLAPPASIRPLLPRKVAVGLCSRYRSASAVRQVHGAVGDSWGYSRGAGRSPPRWLRVSISQFFPVAFVSLLVLASVSANDLATPGGCSDTHLFSEFPWVGGPGRPLAFPLRSHEPVSQRCAVPAVPDLRLHAGRTHPRLLCRWRRLVPSGS